MTTLADERQQIRSLLNEQSPADAFTAYYALHHDPQRTQLFLHTHPSVGVDGFLVRAQTGLDLFRPVVVIRAASDTVVTDLLCQGLIASRPYYLVADLNLSQAINRALTISDAEILCVYTLDLKQFDPVINVLVVAKPTPEGAPRLGSVR